ncbi:hypothetical protein FE697_016215 [Mumia zhuanghuii]|uniref:Uncharacterized protein n=1 Tax=Mumia zhuanghuii TaxID=2585211 RepID=A0A5Q6RR10_9ACTN|nr:hypothetical protein FE697_016215 [Mumia zhuanghuii]
MPSGSSVQANVALPLAAAPDFGAGAAVVGAAVVGAVVVGGADVGAVVGSGSGSTVSPDATTVAVTLVGFGDFHGLTVAEPLDWPLQSILMPPMLAV